MKASANCTVATLKKLASYVTLREVRWACVIMGRKQPNQSFSLPPMLPTIRHWEDHHHDYFMPLLVCLPAGSSFPRSPETGGRKRRMVAAVLWPAARCPPSRSPPSGGAPGWAEKGAGSWCWRSLWRRRTKRGRSRNRRMSRRRAGWWELCAPVGSSLKRRREWQT